MNIKPAWDTLLAPVIRHAEDIFRANVEHLARMQRPLDTLHLSIRQGPKKRPEITEETVDVWLRTVQHKVNTRRRNTRVHATARLDQRIEYNALYLEEVLAADRGGAEGFGEHSFWHGRLLDLVLHELGHLFTYHFFGTFGHDNGWRQVGRIVGYAPVGCTAEDKRIAIIRRSCVRCWAVVQPVRRPALRVAAQVDKPAVAYKNVADLIRTGLLEGVDTQGILARLAEHFPGSKATHKDVAYYRHQLRKRGKLPSA